jgi:hypothetical protein
MGALFVSSLRLWRRARAGLESIERVRKQFRS